MITVMLITMISPALAVDLVAAMLLAVMETNLTAILTLVPVSVKRMLKESDVEGVNQDISTWTLKMNSVAHLASATATHHSVNQLLDIQKLLLRACLHETMNGGLHKITVATLLSFSITVLHSPLV